MTFYGPWQQNNFGNPFYTVPRAEVKYRDGQTEIIKCTACVRTKMSNILEWRSVREDELLNKEGFPKENC